MMKGYLESKGIKVSEHKVGSALQQVAPESYEKRRQNTVDKTNPIPYYARYFGHKIHLDQNEKLIQFGCTSLYAYLIHTLCHKFIDFIFGHFSNITF